jgi:glycerol uptake facilitator-like aquaporin
MSGLTFVLSGCAAILVRYVGHPLRPWQTVLVLSVVSALWLVVAVYFPGDISARFNPATTLAFALRRDMGWIMAGAYRVVQFAAAARVSLLARAFFGPAGNRSFGPDLAIGNLSTWWVYLVGPVAGAVLAVGVAYVLRGPAKVQEAAAAVGTPLDRGT